jgi:hypothetical protein
MKSRLCLRVLLALLLLFAQQIAVAHSVYHLYENRPAKVQREGMLVDQVCEQCLAHAQLAGTVAVEHGLLLPVTADDPVALLAPLSFFAVHNAPYRVRAPPRSPTY